ncbi:MAG TPA: M23 family metallopeptidase [Kofleriaceae bacterium]|nr:M23 family metallopeptidase [Kofleriaceae bacterium]
MKGKTARASASASATSAAGDADSDEPLAARLHSAWVLYESLADWQVRSELAPSTYSGARRALSVALAMVTARPGAAVEAALMQEPSLLELRPVAGGVVSGFGVRRDPFRRKTRKKHNGLDLRAGRGVPVHAAGSGLVAKAQRMRGYGRVVFVDHGEGVETRYAHLQRITVHAGQFVAPGDLVGKVGSSGHATGPHLHFEVRLDGRPVAPVEILGLVAADTPLAAWLQDLPRRMAEAAAARSAAQAAPAEPAPAPAKAGKARGKPHRARRGLRSKRPTS